jgi:hypothetical protein
MTGISKDAWDNSPELQASVRRRLINWGWHFFGGMPNLGYADHANFATPPDKRPSRPAEYLGLEDAEEVEYIISTAAQASLSGMRNSIILKTEHVMAHLPQEVKAKIRGMSRSTYQRRRDEAEWWFYRLAQAFAERAREHVRANG